MNITKTKKQSGFTLIEIIIVVVILGILAAIALPKLVENVDRVRAAEAFNTLGNIGKAFEHCLGMETAGTVAPDAASVSNCNDFTKMGLTDPGNNNFTYIQTGNVSTFLTVDARYHGAAADIITFTYDATGTAQTLKACGAGKFKGMCRV